MRTSKLILFNVFFLGSFCILVSLAYCFGRNFFSTIFLTENFMYGLCFFEGLSYPLLQKLIFGKNIHFFVGLMTVVCFAVIVQCLSYFLYCLLISSQGFNDPESFTFFKIFLTTSLLIAAVIYIVGCFSSRLIASK
jgi:hypothetical protein